MTIKENLEKHVNMVGERLRQQKILNKSKAKSSLAKHIDETVKRLQRLRTLNRSKKKEQRKFRNKLLSLLRKLKISSKPTNSQE